MKDIGALLRQWEVDERGVRERMYRSAMPRERERWHALWLISRGWSEARVGEALERDPHTIGERLSRFETEGPAGLAFEQTGGPPPALDEAALAALKTAVQAPPHEAGIDLANWNWKVVRQFIGERFHATLCRSSCLTYLHRLGFVLKRPKKRLLKANEGKREAFLADYLAL